MGKINAQIYMLFCIKCLGKKANNWTRKNSQVAFKQEKALNVTKVD